MAPSVTASPSSSLSVVFPGQGSQRPGMGRDFFERFGSSRLVFEEASEAAGIDLAALCFSEDPRLGLTEYSQPAILATQIAMLCALAGHWGLAPRRFGGHSLGEYTALVAAGVIPLADAVRIVRERGRLMQDAVPPGAGSMVALLGEALGRDAIAAHLDGSDVSIANDNSDAQIVISGPVAAVRAAAARVLSDPATGVSREVELEVSAPFHSWMMKDIEPVFAGMLSCASHRWDVAPASSVTSNVTGGFHESDRLLLCARLTGQLSGTVRWRDNMRSLAKASSLVVEIGPSRPLRSFFRSIGVETLSIVDLRSAERAFESAAAA